MTGTLTATCTRCKEIKPATAFNKDRRRPSGRCTHCRPCGAQKSKEWFERPGNRERKYVYNRARRQTVKVEGLTYYGGVCACCGEDDVRFLTFDHIDGGGRQHEVEIGSHLAPWLRKNGYPAGFQVLCWNCNSGRAANGDTCPHRQPNGRTTCVAQKGSRERRNATKRARRLAVKVETLAHYGGVCACCDETGVRFLTFDHIDGGGKQHRRAEMGSTPLALWLRRNGYPEGFQVLCWNCNSGRHFNGGICPHQDPDGRTTCAMLDD